MLAIPGSAVQFGDMALLLGISTVRLAVAFLLLPMFTQEAIPPLVRNSLFLGLAVITLTLQPSASPASLDAARWLMLFAKEAFIGIAIGIFASSLLWAIESAGQLIDAKAGTSLGALIDPMNGQQTSNSGLFLARLGTFVFMASGGFMFLVGVLLESYALWPVMTPMPELRPDAASGFEQALGRMMLLMLLIAAPVLLVLYIIDAALGLVNRYAPAVNLLTIAPPLKSLIATVVLMILLGSFIDLLVQEFTQRIPGILTTLQKLLVR
jgi:type III secretion protein T